MDEMNPLALNAEQLGVVRAAVKYIIILTLIVVVGSVAISVLKNFFDR